MNIISLTIILILLLASFYYIGKRRSLSLVDGNIRKLHSLPAHYGWEAGINSFIPGFIILAIWVFSEKYIIDS
ncbi:MAG: phosphate ABC transporter permease family protein, partial [Emcibacteraceae bacterium]|nr:phosphate ABC transporter permease family protein [Emcibacteraceae bacterium]